MKTLIDAHTHTVASGHAYSTIQEMARAAADKGIQILGITEHAPSIPGTCTPIYFRNMHVIPREMYGVKLLMGAELNILDTRGTLDLDERYYEKYLDLRIAGIHQLCYTPGTPSSSLIPSRHKEKARPNNLEILRLCKRYEVPVILGSDAHISFSVGDYRYAWPLIEETGFPEALIVNDKPDFFLHYIDKRG